MIVWKQPLFLFFIAICVLVLHFVLCICDRVWMWLLYLSVYTSSLSQLIQMSFYNPWKWESLKSLHAYHTNSHVLALHRRRWNSKGAQTLLHWRAAGGNDRLFVAIHGCEQRRFHWLLRIPGSWIALYASALKFVFTSDSYWLPHVLIVSL